LAEAQEYLIAAARSLTLPDFQRACRYWSLTFDPGGTEPREQVARRHLGWHKDADGVVIGRFVLDPIAGHAFITAIEQQ
jgi:hypothetical protein